MLASQLAACMSQHQNSESLLHAQRNSPSSEEAMFTVTVFTVGSLSVCLSVGWLSAHASPSFTISKRCRAQQRRLRQSCRLFTASSCASKLRTPAPLKPARPSHTSAPKRAKRRRKCAFILEKRN